MKSARQQKGMHIPWKPIVYGLLALVVGVLLLIGSVMTRPEASNVSTSETQPVTQPAGDSSDGPDPQEQQEAAAANMSGMLLLFGSASLLLVIVCVGWGIIEVRKARPAWKTQTKFPRRR